MVRVALLACAAALAVPASTTAAPAQRFQVVVSATIDMHTTMGGCESLARHVDIRNAKPFTLTADQLGRAQNSLFELVATETRTDSYSDAPCASLDRQPTSTCGTVTYKIGSVGTGVGFLNRKSARFVLFYTRIAPDPYAGSCGVNMWGAASTPGSAGKVWVENFPPHGTDPDGFGVSADRSRLAAGKPFTISDSGTATLPISNTNGFVESMSWWVKLTPAS